MGIEPAALSRYVRSCAGYCVATHVLAVGDRHFDNLMLRADGRLFHIDFGFLWDGQPHVRKCFPPPFGFSIEMVEGMGGLESEGYAEFRALCCRAYLALREQAPLLVGLLKLIAGAPAMPGHAEIERVERRLRLDLDCRAATAFFERRIDDALNSHSHRIAGILHRYAMSQKE
mmetsp:Transcript_47657/g.149738  ORF Transcript_47657/g.149738 Transcript_47657/m.149738 type:complete len:173 (-) Transcript_47657:198-716(-)